MGRISRSQQIFSEIELFLDAGKYEDAKVLSAFLEHDALDRESRLRLLLINATLDGPAPYQDDIDRLRNFLDPSPAEKELIQKILLLDSRPAEERAWKNSFGAAVPAWPSDQLPPHGRAGVRSGEHSALAPDRGAPQPATKHPVAGLGGESNDAATRPFEQTGAQYEELLREKEAALRAAKSHFDETVEFFERQLGEKQDLLEKRDAEIREIGLKLDRLATQLEELDRAKDRESLLLRDALAQKIALLQDKDAAMKKSEERLAAQISALEAELGEKQNLLRAHETEIDSLIAKMAELNEKYTELACRREESQRRIADEQQEKAALLHAAASAIDDVDAQSDARIRWLECQLAESQILLHKSGTEWTELCRQIDVLAERLSEAEKARNRTEAWPHEDRHHSPPERKAAGQDSVADEPAGIFASLTEFFRGFSASNRDGNPGWLHRFLIGSMILSMPKTLSARALAVAGAGLLIISLVYTFSGRNDLASEAKIVRLRRSALVSSSAATRGRLAASSNKASPDDWESRVPIDPTARAVNISSQKKVVVGKPTVGRPTDWSEPGRTYVTRRAVALRVEPRFAAISKAEIRAGTFVRMLAAQGQWLKVRSHPSGAVGYVRREFLARLRSIY